MAEDHTYGRAVDETGETEPSYASSSSMSGIGMLYWDGPDLDESLASIEPILAGAMSSRLADFFFGGDGPADATKEELGDYRGVSHG